MAAAAVRPLEIRVGLPSPGGGLARAARRLGYPVMVSANSFFRRARGGEVVGVRRPGRDLAGADACLDSSGYVAMRRYGGYSWSVETYVHGVVAGFPWRWYSAPDYCCEPAVAGCAATVRLRQAATAALYRRCLAVAADAGLPPPVPVLQGWTPDDYQRGWDLLGLDATPRLVGLGSVCARAVHGPAGLMAVLERVDRLLPPGAGLHLYGVKSDGLVAILSDAGLADRVRSVDSMAWEVDARVRFRTGRTIDRRAAIMREWRERQVARAAAAARAAQLGLALQAPGDTGPVIAASSDPRLDDHVRRVARGELDLAAGTRSYFSHGGPPAPGRTAA